MSYQVLARKWRPKDFTQLMGQEHVVTVLVNALMQERLHHAYLFTGTRGVGKTTIARIFAKSLNCQEGISANPCGKCAVCLDVDDGRFVDLIEIDAASRTKVDDTREILDNVQYAPTAGRYKVYLIDEVHMLSKSSFNALLKTLEEPPEHVKFILATTDPQKLPVTVLSRCLQFHLKALTAAQIEQKLTEILNAESVSHDAGALTLIAKAARGSMRDSLSLTDQAIAQGKGHIESANVQQMLGGVDQNWIYKILISLIKQDNKGLLELSKNIASFAPNYHRLLAELLQLLHQVALWQLVPSSVDVDAQRETLLSKFANSMSPEDVQLYYQIVLNGRKDLSYASDEQSGFDMVLLRMLAFKPAAITDAGQAKQVVSANNTDFDDIDLSTKAVEKSPVTQSTPTNTDTKEPVAEEPVAQEPDVLTIDRNAVTADDVDTKSELEQQQAELETLAAEQKQQVEPAQEQATQEESQQEQAPQEQAPQEQVTEEPSLGDMFADVNVEEQAEPVQEAAKQKSTEQASVSSETVAPETVAEHTEQSLPETTQRQGNGQEPVQQQVQAPIEESIQTEPAQEQVQTEQTQTEKMLAARNMLRSRKKAVEDKAKKPLASTAKKPGSAANPNSPLNKHRNAASNEHSATPIPGQEQSQGDASHSTKTTSTKVDFDASDLPWDLTADEIGIATASDAAALSKVHQQPNVDDAAQESEEQAKQSESTASLNTSPSAVPTAQIETEIDFQQLANETFNPETIDPSVIRDANQLDQWAQLIDAMGLGGRVRQLTLNASMDKDSNEQQLVINLDQKYAHINSPQALEHITKCYTRLKEQPAEVFINLVNDAGATPALIQQCINQKRLVWAKDVIKDDDFVQALQKEFGAKVIEESIEPL